MKIREALKNIHTIRFSDKSPPVAKTVASELAKDAPGAKTETAALSLSEEPGIFCIASSDLGLDMAKINEGASRYDRYVYFRIQPDGSGWLISSHSYYLFSFFRHIFDSLINEDVEKFSTGKFIKPAFAWQRVSYDYFLTQEGRLQRNLNRETYIRELARLGFTHIEVNGLAFPKALESGPKGEIYPMFYTYCPALDQFVYSQLNKDLYPDDYLSANLKYLEENAKLAIKYGLTPGLLCFEPRSVPDKFFEKYPMLRGARVDHPFRSFKPRYNMTIAHPKVREHYAEMLQKIMQKVPELGFLSIWSNDSGSGFEHTKSLYVGRNGGAYLIREWKDDAEIAKLAGENALRFFHTLRDAGREINPDFRVMTRLESFYGEHDIIWKGLGDGVDAETASLIARGWDSPYSHPRYPDIKTINLGTIQHLQFNSKEKPLISDLERRKSHAHFYFAVGPHAMFEPLLGIPYPTLTYQKLKSLHENGVNYLAHSGGTFPPELVPFNINHQILHQFLFDPKMDVQVVINSFAEKWVGKKYYAELVEAWKLAEEAILAFPNVSPLYSSLGFTWYRLWVRPLVPNIEAIPQEERNYYEDYMCTTPHNPNNVDLSRDVLFQIVSVEKSRLDVERIDGNVWEPLDKAIQILSDIREEAARQLGKKNVIWDQLIRLRALRCWLMTQRNVAAWIAGVYGFMDSKTETEKKRWREFLQDMMHKEIQNTKELQNLLDSNVEFMAMTDQNETQLIYGENIKESLSKRIKLMEKHLYDKPFIDHDYMFRKSGELLQ